MGPVGPQGVVQGTWGWYGLMAAGEGRLLLLQKCEVRVAAPGAAEELWSNLAECLDY